MKNHQKGNGKACRKIKTNSVALLASVISIMLIIITLTACKEKNPGKTKVESAVFENNNVSIYNYEKEDTARYRPSGFGYENTMESTNAEDEYNDRLDEYQDDPEDELRFDPEIFDFQDD